MMAYYDSDDDEGESMMFVPDSAAKPEKEERLHSAGQGSNPMNTTKRREKERLTAEINYHKANKSIRRTEQTYRVNYRDLRIPLDERGPARKRIVVDSCEQDIAEASGESDEKQRGKKLYVPRKRRRIDEDSDDEEPYLTEGGYLCNHENWTFFDADVHMDPKDFFVFWTRKERDVPQKAVKRRLFTNNILGGNELMLKDFGILRNDDINVRSERRPGEIIYGPLNQPTTGSVGAHVQDGVISLVEQPSKGKLTEIKVLKEQLDLLMHVNSVDRTNEEHYLAIIELEKQILEKQRFVFTAKEYADVIRSYNERNRTLRKNFAKYCPTNVEAVVGCIELLTSSGYPENQLIVREVESLISDIADEVGCTERYLRCLRKNVFLRMSRSQEEYIRNLDNSIINPLTTSTIEGTEEFIAEMILHRAQILFDAGDIPAVVAMIQVVAEMTYSIPNFKKGVSIEDFRDYFDHFWTIGYPRRCDVNPEYMGAIFYDYKPGFLNYMHAVEATDGVVYNSDGPEKLYAMLMAKIDKGKSAIRRQFSKRNPESDVWMALEENYVKQLWMPLVDYAELPLPHGLLQKAKVPYEKIESIVYKFKNPEIASKLVLDIFALFGVVPPSSSDSIGSIIKQFGTLEAPSIAAELDGFVDWSARVLGVLGNTNDGCDIFMYTAASTKISMMSSFNELKEYVGEEDDICDRADIITCAAIDNVFNEFDSEAFKKRTGMYDTTYYKISQIIKAIGGETGCFSLDGDLPSIYSLRYHSRLLSVCPNDDQKYRRCVMTRRDVYNRVLGGLLRRQISRQRKLSARNIKLGYREMQHFLEKYLCGCQEQRTGHALGEPGTYIAFMLSTLVYFRKLSYPALYTYINDQKEDFPELFDTVLFDELMAQFLWKRQGVKLVRKDYNEAWVYTVNALKKYPTSVSLMKLLVDNGARQFEVLRQIVSTHADPLVLFTRDCAKLYAIALWRKRDGIDFTHDRMGRLMTRNVMHRMMKNSSSASSVFVRVWISYKRQLVRMAAEEEARGTVVLKESPLSVKDFEEHIKMFPLSRLLMFDYMKYNKEFATTALARIFDQKHLFHFTDLKEAKRMRQNCKADNRFIWSWKAPFSERARVGTQAMEFAKKDEWKGEWKDEWKGEWKNEWKEQCKNEWKTECKNEEQFECKPEFQMSIATVKPKKEEEMEAE
ncbi:hypothetical protein QR680_003021 [Steinernema hermaphroditum]|uniref:Uncharacterized protein n=1 Tax=Steinernema hermaphroditum TaxID=289476 RepID=A0AA39H7Q0_9BILA|nr:hypothetical protein QR680_003021 [Steinernema hermaphroditum]